MIKKEEKRFPFLAAGRKTATALETAFGLPMVVNHLEYSEIVQHLQNLVESCSALLSIAKHCSSLYCKQHWPATSVRTACSVLFDRAKTRHSFLKKHVHNL